MGDNGSVTLYQGATFSDSDGNGTYNDFIIRILTTSTALTYDNVAKTPTFQYLYQGTAVPNGSSIVSHTDAGRYIDSTAAMVISDVNTTKSIAYQVYKKELTISGTLVVTDRAYDTTTEVAITGGSLTGVISGDTVTILAAVGNMADKNVGTAKSVTAAYTITDADSGNYTVTQPTVTDTVTITAKALTITGATATNRAYNATNVIAVSGGSLVGVEGSEDVTLDATLAAGTTLSADIGEDLAVTVTGYALTGGAIGNYTLAQPTGLTVTITVAHVDLTLDLYGEINTDRSSVTVTAIGAIDTTDIYGDDVVDLTYAWYVNGVLQAGQTSSTYTTSDVTMLGKTIKLVLSVDNTNYSASEQESYVMYYYVVNVDSLDGSSFTLLYNNNAAIGPITHATGTNLYYAGEETLVTQRDTFGTGSVINIEERAIVTEPTEERQHYGVTLTTSDTVTEEGYVVLEVDLYSLETADMRNVEGMYYIVYVYGSSGNKVDCFGLYVPTIAADGTASWNIYVHDLEGLTAVSVTITIGPGNLTPVGTDATDRWMYEV